ncbi:MAG: twitching motility protein PilT [Puniceicoccaceae bacterium]|nr:MAG: twitching motility protein PilT [Puniceicoccaceae bacterium]
MKNPTLIALRVFFLLLCGAGSWVLAVAVPDWFSHQGLAVLVGLGAGGLVILVDVLLKGFSLRGLTALTFGLAIGIVVAWLIGSSPLFEYGDPQVMFLSRLVLFVVCTYLATVIALRGKDEFNLVIPYVRFVPHEVETPLTVVDTSALIDGRVAKLCESRFFGTALILPTFVVDALRKMAESDDPVRQARGRRGLEVLNQLRQIQGLDLRIIESELTGNQRPEEKLLFLAQSMQARLLTTDYALAQQAEFQGIVWLNLNLLAKALHPDPVLGESFELELVKAGREAGQAIGYLSDGSMVVVENSRGKIGRRLMVEVTSILPSAGGRMVFARPIEPLT